MLSILYFALLNAIFGYVSAALLIACMLVPNPRPTTMIISRFDWGFILHTRFCLMELPAYYCTPHRPNSI